MLHNGTKATHNGANPKNSFYFLYIREFTKYFFEIGSIKKPESSEKFREFQIRNYNGVGLIVLWVFCHYILNG